MKYWAKFHKTTTEISTKISIEISFPNLRQSIDMTFTASFARKKYLVVRKSVLNDHLLLASLADT